MLLANIRLVQAHKGPHLALVQALFAEYARTLPTHICAKDFDRELAELPGEYAPPAGRLLLALAGDDPTGCAALRKIGEGVCEMKRLYVRPGFRRHGAGRMLAKAIIDTARQGSYRTLRLDTLPTMTEALALYESLGFRCISPYGQTPSDCALFMELDLELSHR